MKTVTTEREFRAWFLCGEEAALKVVALSAMAAAEKFCWENGDPATLAATHTKRDVVVADQEGQTTAWVVETNLVDVRVPICTATKAEELK